MTTTARLAIRARDHLEGWGRPKGAWPQPCREGETTGHYNAAACDVGECKRAGCICMWHKHGGLIEAVAREMELPKKADHHCQRCGCFLEDARSSYCPPCQDEIRDGYAYSLGKVCSECGKALRNENRACLCEEHGDFRRGGRRSNLAMAEIVPLIYEMYDAGKMQKEIAHALGITPDTVSRHLKKRRLDKRA